MQYSSPLLRGKLVKRYKRFLADVILDRGANITAHCANPGSMMGLAEPGTTVWLSQNNNPKRKLKYSWELVEVDLGVGPTLVGINTSIPNALVADAIKAGTIKPLSNYQSLQREVRYGDNSRIDILLQSPNEPPCYVEVKNVHLMRSPGRAEFPDSVTIRGAKHLRELCAMKKSGHRCVMLYLVQRSDAKIFSLAGDIDRKYLEAFKKAVECGVEVYCYGCSITQQKIELDGPIPIEQ